MGNATSYHAGLEAERSVARCYLRAGSKFLAHRFRGQAGEIDLIVKHGAELVFIEVKHSKTHASAAARVQPRQVERIFRTAAEFLATQPKGQETPCRFDIALVDQSGKVEILENALSA